MAGGSTQQVFSSIGAMQTFVENFPMSIFSLLNGKKYTSVIEFLLDLLQYLGMDTEFILNRILSKIFEGDEENKEENAEKIQRISDLISNIKYNMNEDVMYERLEEMGELETPFIDKAEDIVKVGLAELLAGLLSCNCIPQIPNRKMDRISNKVDYGYISIPVSMFDMFNKLSIAPTSSTGTCYYQMDTEFVYIEVPEFSVPSEFRNNEKTSIPDAKYGGDKYFKYDNRFFKLSKKSLLSVGNLYQTNDLDAFIWYVLNRGLSHPQFEMNKMMWDSRLIVAKDTAYNSAMESRADSMGKDTSKYENNVMAPARSTEKEWKFWLKSKQDEEDELYYSGQTKEDKSIGYNKNSALFPIMQLERDDEIVDERRLRVYISAQRYYHGNYADITSNSHEESTNNTVAGDVLSNVLTPNHTMYKFNYDYVRSIKLFSTKQILASMIKFLYGGSLNGTIDVSIGISQKVIQERLKKVVTNIVKADDLSVENCYYTFSNDEYDNMLYQNELNKYNAVSCGYAGVKERTITEADVIDSINGVNGGTIAGTITNLTKNSQEVSVSGSTDGSVEYGVSFGVNGMSLIETIMMGLLYPFVEALLSPKVILLVVINMDVAGIINMKNLTLEDRDFIVDFLWKKIFALLSSLIVVIKDLIVEILMDLFNEYVQPLISQFMASILLEKVNIWIEFLEEALNCIPLFDFNFDKYKTTVAEVHYADVELISKPDTESEC